MMDIAETLTNLKRTVLERCRERIENKEEHKLKETVGVSTILKRKRGL